MLGTFRLGWRNIWRNRRRTLVTISAIGIGLMLVLIYGGLISGILGDAVNQLDNSGMGHVEVSAKGWRTHRSSGSYLADADRLRAELQLPPGAEIGVRVVSRGLLSSARGNEAVELHGVDWADEARLADYVRNVRQGALPKADDPKGVLIGDKLAERLKVSIGGKVRLMVQRADGEMGAELLRVRGIYHSLSPALAQRRILVSRAASEELLGVHGAHAIIIQLVRATDADAVAQSLRAKLGDGAEVLTYGEIFPMFKTMEALTDSAVLISSLFVYLLVGLGIFNTILMSVLERTREFGVMQALGTRPAGVVGVVLTECFWTATVAVGLGLAVGLAVTWYGSRESLFDYRKTLGDGFEWGGAVMGTAFKTKLDVGASLRAALSVYVMALLVALYPAWKVAKLKPVDALHAK